MLTVPEGVKACEGSCLSVWAGVAQKVIQHQSGQRLLHQLAVWGMEHKIAKVVQAEALL